MAENDAVVETVDPAPVADPAPAPAPEAAPEPAVQDPAPQPKPSAWPAKAIERINEVTAKQRQIEAEKQAAETRARNAEEMLARMQRGEKPAEEPRAPVQPLQPQPQGDDYSRHIQAEAARQVFLRDVQTVQNAGLAAFPNFADTINILTAVGVAADDCVADIIETVGRENAHVFLNNLAKEPEKAANLAKMNPRARIAQLARMVMAEQPKVETAPAPAPKPAAVSKAPPPKPVLDPSAPSGDPGDLMEDNIPHEEWERRFKEKEKRQLAAFIALRNARVA